MTSAGRSVRDLPIRGVCVIIGATARPFAKQWYTANNVTLAAEFCTTGHGEVWPSGQRTRTVPYVCTGQWRARLVWHKAQGEGRRSEAPPTHTPYGPLVAGHKRSCSVPLLTSKVHLSVLEHVYCNLLCFL